MGFELAFLLEQAVAPVARTTPALASLLTGAYPHRSGVRTLTDVLSAAERDRAARFHFADHRRRYEISHGALRRILAGYVGRDAADLLDGEQRVDNVLTTKAPRAAFTRIFEGQGLAVDPGWK